VSPWEPLPQAKGISAAAWIKLLVIAGLFAAVNWRQFTVLVNKWLVDVNWSHGFLIPFFSLYLLYTRREPLFAVYRRSCLWGLGLAVLFIVVILLGYYPFQISWLSQIGMVGLCFSLVLYLGGPGLIRITWLPIWYLVFAMPLPEQLYTEIALPLQELAAKSSTILLQLFGVDIHVTASNLTITSISGRQYPLLVAEACSGVRSLVAYLALGVAWAYLVDRPIWQRIVLVFFAVPIAILTNVLRVTITSSMSVLDYPELGNDFMHEFTGMLMLGPALLMFWALSRLLQAMFVEHEEADEDPPAEDPSARPKPIAESAES